jgi:hypothetical protein
MGFLEPFFDFFGKVNFLFKEGFYYPSSYSYQERIIFDDRTQMDADNPDFKYKELTEEIIRMQW